MKKLSISLQNCYGIKRLNAEFDFSPTKHGSNRSKAIYAPNGAMKTSLAKTFKDLSKGSLSEDLVFPDRTTTRNIIIEDGTNLLGPNVFVIEPLLNERFESDKMSTLLVNKELRERYEQIHATINEKKEILLRELRELSGLKKGIEEELATAIKGNPKEFRLSIMSLEFEIDESTSDDFTGVEYKVIFNDKVESALSNPEIRENLEAFVSRYDELISRSRFFKRGIFNHNNASVIAKELEKNGFFKARHKVYLQSKDEQVIVDTEVRLVEVIEEEKARILSDQAMASLFDKVNTALIKNVELRDFLALIQETPALIPHLVNLKELKSSIWKFYLRKSRSSFAALASEYRIARTEIQQIENKAKEETNDWWNVVGIFNKRFFVPFQLIVDNQEDVILKSELPSVGFVFEEKGQPAVSVKRDSLISVLSTGEKRALYILNIIFEVEARKKAKQKTLFIIDDIADSFDYKNKYAIIEYLRDINMEDFFFQIVLTHNFDFFRTLASRYVGPKNCQMIKKSQDEVKLVKCPPFNILKHFKDNLHKNKSVFVASIPLARNLVEYSRGNSDPNWKLLTSVLHLKKNTPDITVGDVINIFKEELQAAEENFATHNLSQPIVDFIHAVASEILIQDEEDGVNLENKICMAIAIRLKAEKIMIDLLNSPDDVAAIRYDQTNELYDLIKVKFPNDYNLLALIERVVLMTPENIHLNSFMYEPIVDMADEHLNDLYKDLLDCEAQVFG